jgi:hypothetical protein
MFGLMNGSKHIIVNLNISPEEYTYWYTGTARTVLATSIDGRSVRFPANILQPFVTREGIQGTFCIYFKPDGKFDRIERL